MDVSWTDQPPARIQADAIVVGCYLDEQLSGPAAALDAATAGMLGRLVESKEITGKLVELTTVLAPPGISAGQILVVGLGRREEFDEGAAFRALAAAAKCLAAKKRQRVACCVDDDWNLDRVEGGVCGLRVGCQGQDLYRAEKKLNPFPELFWSGGDQPAVDSGCILGDSVNLTRELVNRPPSEIFPESFAAGRSGRPAGRTRHRNLGRAEAGRGAMRLAVGSRPGLRSAAPTGHPAVSRVRRGRLAAGPDRQGGHL